MTLGIAGVQKRRGIVTVILVVIVRIFLLASP
jgi:hypothetical protein